MNALSTIVVEQVVNSKDPIFGPPLLLLTYLMPSVRIMQLTFQNKRKWIGSIKDRIEQRIYGVYPHVLIELFNDTEIQTKLKKKS